MVMKLINIHDAKARLSEYLELVEQGERVLICRRNQPIAELRKVAAARSEPRPTGGTVLEIPEAFFEPLPDEEVGGFYGDLEPGVSAVAESGAAYGSAAPHGSRSSRG